MKIRCPQCKTELEEVPSDFEPRPFCSMRCKLADLSNWLNETYRIPQEMADDDVEASDYMH